MEDPNRKQQKCKHFCSTHRKIHDFVVGSKLLNKEQKAQTIKQKVVKSDFIKI